MTVTAAAMSLRLDAEVIQELAAEFRGVLIQPGDPPYDEARRVWNGMIDRRPAVVARCHGAVSYTHLTLPTIYSV